MCFFRLLLIWFLLSMAVVLAVLPIYCLFLVILRLICFSKLFGWSLTRLSASLFISLFLSPSVLSQSLSFSSFVWNSIQFYLVRLSNGYLRWVITFVWIIFALNSLRFFVCLVSSFNMSSYVPFIRNIFIFFIFHGLLLVVSWVNLWIFWISYPLWMNRERFNEQ